VKNIFIIAGLSALLLFFVHNQSLADCAGDFDRDGDIDGSDLVVFIEDFGRTDCGTVPPCEADIHPPGFPDGDVDESDLAVFAADFGRTDCPLPAPLNLFNIGNSIGEGEAAYGDIGAAHHEAVWSTGYNPGDIVFSLNERFENVDPEGYDENDIIKDATFNHAASGAVMADFVIQANEAVAAAAATPSGTVGMVTILLGNNDVCSAADPETMIDPVVLAAFESQYRAGLDVLAASDATRNAYIHISGIPAIYWLWIAKRTNLWCRLFVWPFVPCQILLADPVNDCGVGDSHLDPDTIHPDDGDNCKRRKQFHTAIRDFYNPILRDVLMEYKEAGLLPNAYYVDIFNIQFEEIHVNDGDCFHPSVVGHEMLGEEQWRRSPWSLTDPLYIH